MTLAHCLTPAHSTTRGIALTILLSFASGHCAGNLGLGLRVADVASSVVRTMVGVGVQVRGDADKSAKTKVALDSARALNELLILIDLHDDAWTMWMYNGLWLAYDATMLTQHIKAMAQEQGGERIALSVQDEGAIAKAIAVLTCGLPWVESFLSCSTHVAGSCGGAAYRVRVQSLLSLTRLLQVWLEQRHTSRERLCWALLAIHLIITTYDLFFANHLSTPTRSLVTGSVTTPAIDSTTQPVITPLVVPTKQQGASTDQPGATPSAASTESEVQAHDEKDSKEAVAPVEAPDLGVALQGGDSDLRTRLAMVEADLSVEQHRVTKGNVGARARCRQLRHQRSALRRQLGMLVEGSAPDQEVVIEEKGSGASESVAQPLPQPDPVAEVVAAMQAQDKDPYRSPVYTGLLPPVLTGNPRYNAKIGEAKIKDLERDLAAVNGRIEAAQKMAAVPQTLIQERDGYEHQLASERQQYAAAMEALSAQPHVDKAQILDQIDEKFRQSERYGRKVEHKEAEGTLVLHDVEMSQFVGDADGSKVANEHPKTLVVTDASTPSSSSASTSSSAS